jgi:3-hydroxyisobutyrate dehydrogenase
MEANAHRLGWVGMGRMGYPLAERLLAAGHDLSIWNRTRAKAEPLAAKGARIVDRPADLAEVDVLFTMVSTGKDLEQVYFGDHGVAREGSDVVPQIFVDCSSIGVDQSAAFRERLSARGAVLIAAPVSGNGKCVKAGKLSAVASGPEPAYRAVAPYLEAIAGRGVSYVGEGELARICKIAHNVMLGVVIQNLAEITVLTQKAGVPRHAFLDFINKSVMGSTFTKPTSM